MLLRNLGRELVLMLAVTLLAVLLYFVLTGAAHAQELQRFAPSGQEPCGPDGCPNAVRLVRHESKPAPTAYYAPMPLGGGPTVVHVAPVRTVALRHPVLMHPVQTFAQHHPRLTHPMQSFACHHPRLTHPVMMIRGRRCR